MFNLFGARKETPEQKFWKWFAAQSARYLRFEEDQEPLFDALQRRLAGVRAGLSFEFGPEVDGARDFVLSADGNTLLFPAVRRLVDAAPELPGWRLIAFRPRRGTNLILGIGGVEVGPEHLWFHLEPDGEMVGVRLFLEGFEDVESEEAAMASFLLLDSALGEFDVETKMGFLERHALPPQPQSHGLRPFHEIADAFDALFASLHS